MAWQHKNIKERVHAELHNPDFERMVGGAHGSAVSFLLPVLIVWSAVTEFGLFYTKTLEATSSTGTAVLVAVVGTLLLELVKFKGGSFIARMSIYGWLRHKSVFMYWLAWLPFVLAAFVASGYFTIKGTPQTLAYFTEQITPPPLEDLDKMRADHKAVIDEANARFESSNSIVTSTGEKDWNGTRTAGKVQDEILLLRNRHDAEIQAATERNKSIQQKYDEKLAVNQAGVSTFGGWSEGLQLAMYFLIAFYRREIFRENNDPEPSPFIPVPTSDLSAAAAAAQPAPATQTAPFSQNRTPIGFRTNNQNSYPESKKSGQNQRDPLSRQEKPTPSTKIKTSVGDVIELSVPPQTDASQDQQPKPVTNLVFVKDDVPVFKHIGDDGNVKFCNEGYCKNMVGKYEGRVADSRKLYKLKPTDRNRTTLANREQWLNYWTDALKQIGAMNEQTPSYA